MLTLQGTWISQEHYKNKEEPGLADIFPSLSRVFVTAYAEKCSVLTVTGQNYDIIYLFVPCTARLISKFIVYRRACRLCHFNPMKFSL